MIERTADICIKNETCQNNLIKTRETLSKAYQDNLKNLIDSSLKKMCIFALLSHWLSYISRKCFRPLWEIRSFIDRRYDIFPLVHGCAVFPILGFTPYMPECGVYQ